jgi:hypothetical protein
MFESGDPVVLNKVVKVKEKTSVGIYHIINIIDRFVLTGAIGVFATENFIGAGNFPQWFTGSVGVSSFSIFAAIEGLIAILALYLAIMSAKDLVKSREKKIEKQ